MPRMPDLQEHPMLLDKVTALEPEEFQAHVVVAEALLQVDGIVPQSDVHCQQMDAAVALQVNFQVETGVEGYYLQEARRGARTFVFRGQNRMPHLSRQALELVRRLKRNMKLW